MGTRSGDLDPAVVPFLAERLSMGVTDVEDVLNRKSGLLGLAGAADLRAVNAAANDGDERAQLALKVHAVTTMENIDLGAYMLAGPPDPSAGMGRHCSPVTHQLWLCMWLYGIFQGFCCAQVYVHRLRRYLGAYLLQLGHVDAIIFSAGVGENSPEIRRRALAGLQVSPSSCVWPVGCPWSVRVQRLWHGGWNCKPPLHVRSSMCGAALRH